MKTALRISIKDYRRNKSLKALLYRTPWPKEVQSAECRMQNGERWPKGVGTASLSRVFSALRKGVVRGAIFDFRFLIYALPPVPLPSDGRG